MKLGKYKRKASRAVGGDLCLYAIVFIAAIFVANYIGIFNNLAQSEFTNTEGETTTHYIYETITETVTVPEPPPEGTWYYFSVAFTWTDLVVSGDERDIWIGISSTDTVGLADHTFDSMDENTFYTFTSVRFEEGYDMKLNMMSMWPIPPQYKTIEAYNVIEAQALSGQIPFYRSDYLPPLGADISLYVAGYIMWTWVPA